MDTAKIANPAAPDNEHERIGIVFQFGDHMKCLIAAVMAFIALALANILDGMLP
jgi:hypothetical protein